MSPKRWRDLPPDPALLQALEFAGPRPKDGTDDKRNWGTRFADACAVMFADAMRAHATFRKLEIRPNADGTGRESLTGVGGRGQKKVDVIASTLAAGLQVALSLKAENFPSKDKERLTYGKNLTNRIYELQDEVRAIHEYQPRAHVVGVFYLPLAAAMDRTAKSTFARLVAMLRARSGRIDFSLPTQLNRLDKGVVGLYVPATTKGGPKRGVVRYFDVETAPPASGRPRLETTMTLEEVIETIAKTFREEAGEVLEYADPEED